jgi:nitrite reductase/ring-hydroxylating ferredoxin subunit/uncharacterized membrane protein
MLVAAPIGLFSGALLLDLTGDDADREAARRLLGAGVLSVLPTAAAGLADWSELGAFHRPRRVGLVHALSNVVGTVLFTASWVARRRGAHRAGRRLALAGSAGLVVGGYLGGHLTYSEGVGVNRNADRQPPPAEWTDAAAAADVPPGALHTVEVAGQPVLLANVAGRLYALGGACSHYGGPLGEGEIRTDGAPCVSCPWHGSRFRLEDGSVAAGPATSPQQAYDVRTVDGRVQVMARSE